MLTTMIEEGQSVMSDNRKLYEEAMRQYVKYRGSRYMLRRTTRVSSLSARLVRRRNGRKPLP